MTDPELQKLADLWQEPDGPDDAKLVELARKARRKAWLMAYGDWAWLLLVGASVIATTWLHPSLLSVLAGIATLAVTLWLTWRRRAFHRMSGSLDTSDRPAFLASMARIVRNDLRRVTLSLVMFAPVMMIAIFFKLTTRNPSDPLSEISAWATSTRGVIVLIVLAAITAFILRSWLRLKAQLDGLKKLRKTYLEEAERDERDAA
jgi:hypothetical protein